MFRIATMNRVYIEYTWFTPFPNRYTNIRIYPYIIQVMCFFNKHDIVMFLSTTQIYVWVVTAGMVGMQTFHRVQPQNADSRNVPGVTTMMVVYLFRIRMYLRYILIFTKIEVSIYRNLSNKPKQQVMSGTYVHKYWR